MRRRTLIKTAGGAAVLGLTGCIDQLSGEDDDEGGGNTYTESFEVTNIESGQEVDEADVSFDEEAKTVTIEGVISGSDMCTSAELDETALSSDDRDEEFTVNVVTFDDSEEDEMCGQAIVEISYTAVFEFSEAIPKFVNIEHDGEGVGAHGYSSTSDNTGGDN